MYLALYTCNNVKHYYNILSALTQPMRESEISSKVPSEMAGVRIRNQSFILLLIALSIWPEASGKQASDSQVDDYDDDLTVGYEHERRDSDLSNESWKILHELAIACENLLLATKCSAKQNKCKPSSVSN